MSVILFSKNAVYQEMADSYEGLESLLRANYYACSTDDTTLFYKSLRRLYFANVAAYLCQYHDDTPEDIGSLAIDPFMELEGKADPLKSPVENALAFLDAWGSLRYNLMTNDGERFMPKEAYAFMEQLAAFISEAALKSAAEKGGDTHG